MRKFYTAEAVTEGHPNKVCDQIADAILDTLITLMRKDFGTSAMPGQPMTSSGKPYKYIVYSNAYVQVDKMENVEFVCAEIRNLGYNASSNIEMIESSKQQMAIIQAVLGGIGFIGLLGGISYIPVWLALISMVFAVFAGMTAGYFPARRAMKLSPLSAIRNE